MGEVERKGIERELKVDRVSRELKEISPDYPEPNRALKLWQVNPAPVINAPDCKLCRWAINGYLNEKDVNKMLSVASKYLNKEFNGKVSDFAEKRTKEKLEKEFKNKEGEYEVCRFCLLRLAREEAEHYLIKKNGYSYKELKERFREYTKKLILLYDWDLPRGGAGGNPLY